MNKYIIKGQEISQKTLIIFLAVIVVLFLIVPLIIQYFNKSEANRIENEIKQLEFEKRILLQLEKQEIRKLKILEVLNKYVPYIIRVIFIFSLLFCDYIMHKYLGKGTEFIDIFKEITILNTLLLTIFLCISFIFNGKWWKIEELVKYINEKINDGVFNCYFPETHNRHNSKSWYIEDIEKRELRISELRTKRNIK